MEKRLIDATHLKDRIMNSRSGSWYDLYQLVALIDSEPTETPEKGKSKMSYIMLIPAVIFAIMVLGIILYIMF